MGKKTCGVCANEYNDAPENWSKKAPSTCKLCLLQQQKKQAERKQARRAKRLAKIESAGVDLFAEIATNGGSNIPHSAEVLERVFQYFGGVSGFASILVKQYYDSPPGSSARNKLIETITRLVSKNVEAGGAKKPLSLWTEDELEAELDARFQQAIQTYKGITLDAKALPPSPDSDTTDHSIPALPDRISEGRDQVDSVRTEGKKAGGSEAIPADPDPAEDS